MWAPIIITDRETGRKVHYTIIDAELYKAGVCNFDALWDIYDEDISVQIINGLFEPA